MKCASTQEINKFFIQCRQIIATIDVIPSTFVVVRSEKYKKTMLELGLTDKQLIEIIEELSLENYSKGPCDDRDFSGTVWIFGKNINEREVYIKLKISECDDRGNAVSSLICLSFHFSEKHLTYPYTQKE